VRLISANIADPPAAVLATGGITSGDLGRIVTSSGLLQVPPAGGNVGSNGWTSVVGGYRCRINEVLNPIGGTGSINVFLPQNVIDPLNSGADFLTDLVTYPIGVAIGQPLAVTGFLRHFDGEFEIVVLRNQSGYID